MAVPWRIFSLAIPEFSVWSIQKQGSQEVLYNEISSEDNNETSNLSPRILSGQIPYSQHAIHLFQVIFHFLKHPSFFLLPSLFNLVLTLFVRALLTFSDLPQGLALPECHHSHAPVL